MSENVQLLIVIPIVAVCAFFAVRALIRQFTRPDDEPEGCSGCSHNPTSEPSNKFPKIVKQ